MPKPHFTHVFKTPFGDLSIVVNKRHDNLVVEFISLFGKQDAKAPVKEVKEFLQDLIKWIDEGV